MSDVDPANPSRGCRSCGSGALREVLDLGELPLAGDFRPAGERNRLYPLAIDVCAACGLLQVREVVDPSVIFTPNYSYASSTVPGLVRHFEEFAAAVARPPGSPALLLEIGCNDGVFLRPLAEKGYRVVGIDASENVSAMARQKGLDVRTAVFGKKVAQELREEYGVFDVITCSNVFAHNPLLHDLLDGVDTLLREGGELWIEVHDAESLYSGLQWDCFYHEHCFYWTIHALRDCLSTHGYVLARHGKTPMHGGALRAVFSNRGDAMALPAPELTPESWARFGGQCIENRDLIRDCVEQLGVRYAYGAAGRAVVLINWAGIGGFLEFVVDGSPLRYGRVIPNTSIPVISEEAFFGMPAVDRWCLVTAHNYLRDIRRKVEAGLRNGARIRFVTPLPNVSIT